VARRSNLCRSNAHLDKSLIKSTTSAGTATQWLNIPIFNKTSPWRLQNREGDVPGYAAGRVRRGAGVHAHVDGLDVADDEAVDDGATLLTHRNRRVRDATLARRRKVGAGIFAPRNFWRRHALSGTLHRRP